MKIFFRVTLFIVLMVMIALISLMPDDFYQLIRDVHSQMMQYHENPKNYAHLFIGSLYLFSIPLLFFSIFVFLTSKNKKPAWIYLVLYLLYPWVATMSILIHEVLGALLVSLFIWLLPLLFIRKSKDNYKIWFGLSLVIAVLYAVTRLTIGGSGWCDIVFLFISGLYPLCMVFVNLFTENGKPTLHFSIPFLLNFVFLFILFFGPKTMAWQTLTHTTTDNSVKKVQSKDYNEVRDYSNGMAAVEAGNFILRKWGFIDESGKEVIPCIYLEVLSFSENLAAAKKDKWGFIDKNGNEVIPFKYNAVWSFSEGMAAFRVGNEIAGRWGYIDKNGTEVIPCQYEAAGSFSEGLAWVRSNGLIGFIDRVGNVIITPKYARAGTFSNGYARVGEFGKGPGGRGSVMNWGLINRNGQLIAPCKYSRIDDFDGDLAKVTKRGGGTVPGMGTTSTNSGVINRSGKEIIPCIHFGVKIGEDIIEVTTMRGEHQYFDRLGNRVNR